MITQGMGRVRVGRLAAVSVPAFGASLAVGFAILQGSMTAALSSADPFALGSSGGKADQMGISMATTETATAVDNGTAVNKKVALARLKNGNLNDICIVASQNFPVLGNVVSLKIASTAPVAVGDIDLNADSLNLAKADLPATDIGTSADDNAIGGKVGAFGLKTDNTNQAIKLTDLNAQAYRIRLNNGLSMQNLSVAPKLGSQSCS